MKKILEQLKKLDSLTLEYIIIQLLKENKLDIKSILTCYEKHLKDKDKEKNIIITKMGLWLTSYWQEHIKASLFMKAASAYVILKSQVMKGAPIEKDLKQFLLKNKYEEDENGFPKTKLHYGKENKKEIAKKIKRNFGEVFKQLSKE